MRLDLSKKYKTKSGITVTLIYKLDAEFGPQFIGVYRNDQGYEETNNWNQNGGFFNYSTSPSSMDLVEVTD